VNLFLLIEQPLEALQHTDSEGLAVLEVAAVALGTQL